MASKPKAPKKEAAPKAPKLDKKKLAKELLAAIDAENTAQAAKLLKQGADPNARGSDKVTALQEAARVQSVELVQLLLTSGADPNGKDQSGYTPLHLAASTGQQKVVDLLLEAGADAEVPNEFSATALHGAAEKGHTQIVSSLLERGAQPGTCDESGESALFKAASRGHLAAVKALLERTDPDQLDRKDELDWTALTKAAFGKHWEVAIALAERGARLEVPARFGSARELAQNKGGPDVVQQLEAAAARAVPLSRQPQKAAQAVNPRQSFAAALEAGDLATVKSYLAKKVPLDEPLDGLGTPLQIAAAAGHLPIVEALLDAGADVRAWSRDATALHASAHGGHLHILALLLARGAEVDAWGSSGTALHAAAAFGQAKAIEALLRAGAKPDTLDDEDEGYAPLHHAAMEGHLEAVLALLAGGANANVRSRGGRTPLALAQKRGQHPVAAALKQAGAALGRS